MNKKSFTKKIFTDLKSVFKKTKEEESTNQETKKSDQLTTKEQKDRLRENHLVLALLEPLSSRKEWSIKQLAAINEISFLQYICKSNFFETFSEENWQGKRRECLYELFMLFSKPGFAEAGLDYNREVLTWLANENVEETIENKDKVTMVHWLAANNNLEGVKWAFEWYHNNKREEGIKKIVFESYDKYEQDIFDYVIDGILDVIEEANYPQATIIGVVLEEFAATIDDEQEKKERVNEKKELIKLSLLRKTDLTYELNEELLVERNEFGR